MSMNESELCLHRCCFTGHRPEKLSHSEWQIKQELEREIRCALKDGYTVFISGMARGVDIWAAEIVLKIRSEGEFVRLICASPSPGFEQSWSRDWKEKYVAVLQSADLVRYICKSYSRSCFQTRNEWMVDHSSRVIAVFNGEPSGTKNTIDYSLYHHIPIRYIKG